MDPRKESNHILVAFLREWVTNYNLDGWIVMVRFDRSLGEFGAWEICAAHPDPLHNGSYSVGVRSFVTYDEWSNHHTTIIEQRAEVMHAESFMRENQAPAGEVAFRARNWWERFVTVR